MRITVRRAQDAPSFVDSNISYRSQGWPIMSTPTGVALVTARVCGIEMAGDPVADLLRLMHRNGTSWPTLDMPGNRRLVVLAAAPVRRDEIRSVAAARARLRHGGALVPLPPTTLAAGPVRWVIAPQPGAQLPTLETVVSAIRQATDWRYTATPRAAW